VQEIILNGKRLGKKDCKRKMLQYLLTIPGFLKVGKKKFKDFPSIFMDLFPVFSRTHLYNVGLLRHFQIVSDKRSTATPDRLYHAAEINSIWRMQET